MNNEWYLTGKQLAEVLGIKPQTLRVWRWRGDGPPYIRFGGLHGRVIYRATDVDKWLAERTFRNTSEETVKATRGR